MERYSIPRTKRLHAISAKVKISRERAAVTGRLLWLAPVILVVLAAEYHAIVRWEEQMLESRLGEGYSDYVSRVPRWVPSHVARSRVAVSAPSAASARRFSWRQTLFSERGTLIAIAAGYLLLWTKARF